MKEVKEIKKSAYHEIPEFLKTFLLQNNENLEKWNSLTDIQRNEWICWLTIPKKEETKEKHFLSFQREIISGLKNPCCWPGCPHRNKNSLKYFAKK